MKTLSLFRLIRSAFATAALLLCAAGTGTGLRAQDTSLYFSPAALSWTSSDTSEKVVYLYADSDLTWTLSGYGYFTVDITTCEGSDFVHIQPSGANTSGSDITAVITATAGTHTATLTLTQYAQGSTPELISLPGNWTITRTYTNAAGTSSYEDITFYDGLGYAEQVVQVGASPTAGKNIVTPVWYDNMRRSDARTYLPYVSGNSTRVEENTSTVLSSQAAWYNANGYSGQGAYAFAAKTYETSPLDRPLGTFKPGSVYASASGNRPVTLAYAANTASEVRKLSVDASGQLVLSGGWYAAGTLHKLTTTDEDGAVSVTWTDNLGRTVMTRQLSATSVNLDTYYAYDDAGNLCWVVTPEGTANLGTSGTWPLPTSANGTSSSTVQANAAARFCYVYTWDGRGRQLTRKIPGKRTEYFVYDRDGRLVMSQDGLAGGSKWTTFKYDAQGHLVQRALLTHGAPQSYFQGIFDAGTAASVVYPSSGTTVLETYVYGSYTAAASAGLAFAAVSGVVTASDVDQSRIKGLKTYEKVAVLDGAANASAYGSVSSWIERAFYYDALGRLVQTVEKNAMGTTSRYSTKYDFRGNVLASREQHGTDYKASSFSYDGRGRLLSETTSVNGGTAATLSYAYDPLGRLKTTTSGSGTAAVTTTDSWNIQGWLTSRTASKSGSNVFTMSLGYYTPTVSGPAAKYSGDISSWSWTQSGQSAKSYGFTYDGAHRLTAGQCYSGATATNALSEKSISYDKNGNITALTRYNNTGSATSLTYAYTGNYRNTFSYDANGNVTSDATNSLQTSYNLLNLPSQIKSGSTVKANYTYLSDGTKAKALNASGVGYDYAGTFTYSHASNGAKTLESVAFGGGRIRKSGSSYLVDYHVTDHLGSVRAIVTSGSIVEQDDYYPFGARHSNGLTQLTANRWRFGGKEEQDGAFGVAYSDFGARFLASGTAGWTSIDPLAEKYYSVSPYAYCNNNPVKFVDPEGRKIRYSKNVSRTFKERFAKTVQFMNEHGTSGNIAELEASPSVYYIEEVHSVEKVHFDPSTRVITWDPYHVTRSEEGILTSPATHLFHEIDHALLYDTHPEISSSNQSQIIPLYGNLEEKRATENEQKAARKHQELFGDQVTRTDHKRVHQISVENLSVESTHEYVKQTNQQLWEWELEQR